MTPNPGEPKLVARWCDALPYAVCVAPIAVYQLLYFRGFYPITEGWFSEYAHLIRLGEVPYRDFHVLLPPLYPLQIALFQSLFGDGLFPLRLLGVFVTCAIALALMDLLRSTFNPWASAFAAAVGTIFYQAGVAYIGYDFTQFLTLYLLVAAALLVRSTRIGTGMAPRRAPWIPAFAGMFLACAFLIKQSNGGIAAVFIGIVAVVCWLRMFGFRPAIVRTAATLAGFFLPVAGMLAWLGMNGALNGFWRDVFAGAAQAKGGVSVALFRWIWHYFNDPPGYLTLAQYAAVDLAKIVGAVIVIAAIVEARRAVREEVRDRRDLLESAKRVLSFHAGRDSWAPIVVGTAALCALTILIVAIARGACPGCTALFAVGTIVEQIEYVWSGTLYAAALAAGLILMFFRARSTSRAPQIALLGALGLGLTFGNGTSAGLSEISSFLGIAILAAFLVENWLGYALPAVVPIVAALSMSGFYLQAKFDVPYSWWLMKTPAVRSSDCAPAEGDLAGLCMAPADYAKIARIQSAILANSRPGDPIYVYPHMPIFYLLTNRLPFDGAVVSWFDFTSKEFADEVGRKLRVQPPPVLVVAEIPTIVLTEHEKGFNGGKPLGQREIIAAIAALRKSGRITSVAHIRNLELLDIDVYKRCAVARPCR